MVIIKLHNRVLLLTLTIIELSLYLRTVTQVKWQYFPSTHVSSAHHHHAMATVIIIDLIYSFTVITINVNDIIPLVFNSMLNTGVYWFNKFNSNDNL